MRIISYNVNGIRAAIRKGFLDWIQQANPDVVCLQEIKAQPDQLNLEEFTDAGYPYQYWYPAKKKGYSGVAILSKTEPNHVEYGTGIDYMDAEGRNIRADFNGVSVMSLYLPICMLVAFCFKSFGQEAFQLFPIKYYCCSCSCKKT